MLQKVPESAQRLRFATPRGKVSRRDLLRSLLPKDQAIPYVEPTKCRGERCALCRQNCPFEAISADERGVSIDGGACRGCGVCIGACPRGAIIHPQFSLSQLNLQLESVLLSEGSAGQPKVATMLCQSSGYSASYSEGKVREHAGDLLSVEMPCLAMASPWLMLRAFDLGAQGLALICDSQRCPFRFDAEGWRGTVRFIQALFSHWGVGPERVSLLGKADLEEELLRFERATGALAPVSLRPSRALASPAEDLPLGALIRGMGESLGMTPAGTISAGTVPFGRLTLHATSCTGCGLCAADCPTGALAFASSGLEGYQILFSHGSCTGCGLCAKVCPEQCLEVERILELNRLKSPPQIISEGGLVICQLCGAPTAPKAMIEKIRARMVAAGGNTSRLETCPDCKMGGRSKSARSRAGM